MSNAGKATSSRYTKRKMATTSTRDALPVDELAQLFASKAELTSTQFEFGGDVAEKERLAHFIWRDDLLVGTEAPTLRSGNRDLINLFVILTKNTYGEVSEIKESLWQEAIVANLMRIKSQKVSTLLTVRVSIEAARVQLNREFWQLLHLLAPGILWSHNTTNEFVGGAFKLRPGPEYEVLEGVGCVMFDNYTRKVLYSSVHTKDSWGFRLDMTNSCTMAIPRHLAPPNFNVDAICNALCTCPYLPCTCPQLYMPDVCIVDCREAALSDGQEYSSLRL